MMRTGQELDALTVELEAAVGAAEPNKARSAHTKAVPQEVRTCGTPLFVFFRHAIKNNLGSLHGLTHRVLHTQNRSSKTQVRQHTTQ